MPTAKPRILADNPEMPTRLHLPRKLMFIGPIAATLSLGVMTALATAPGQHLGDISVREVVENLAVNTNAPLPLDDDAFVRLVRIRSGDSISSLLERLGASDDEIRKTITGSEEGQAAVRGMRAGEPVTATVTSSGRILSLDILMNAGAERYSVIRDGNLVRESVQQRSTDTAIQVRGGTIQSSLFAATDEAGLSDDVAMKLAELFGTEIDFHTDLRKGDKFSVVFESVTESGVEISTGRILAAEFINKGKRYAVVLFREKGGRESYYTPDGRSLRQAFLRSPLEFSRVTSGFAMRFHPIRKMWRQHKGVDFGAPTGTAVKATSDGTVEFVGEQRGYGNVIKLRHRNDISTLYAHLNGFAKGLRKGESVEQGEIIGYVGQTGWATGPHLHYEFRASDEPLDPMSADLPTAQPLSKEEMARFDAQVSPSLARLATLNRATALVSNK
ncbi:MAG: M23 family metallopeptidase [Rhodocyclaceae bacterium]|nr:M23 family metallopeptidase [Rhodocyclaceae bacterium]